MHLLPENIVNLAAAVTDRLSLPGNKADGITVDVLRLDKIDPVISGNKWFKLKYYLENALQQRLNTVLTFGGAWSNHIVAAACAAKRAGLQSIGIIRGEKPTVLSATLQSAASWGMELVYVSRERYNQKKNPAFTEQLLRQYNNPLIIPEGGEGETGIRGAKEILQLTNKENYTHIVCAIGTGTLLAGIARSSFSTQAIIGIPVLKGFDNWVVNGIDKETAQRVQVLTEYHLGGYAKKNGALFSFMNEFYRQTLIPTDFVYTGKLFFSLYDLLKKDYFSQESRILVIHSGGLQGNNSLPPGTLIF